MTDPTKDHSRVSPEGRAMGKSAARLAELGYARLRALGLADAKATALRADMCKSCACRPGTVPNGCLQTQMDLLKAAAEGKPFQCHAPRDGKLCAGWLRVRAEIVARPLPPQLLAELAAWDYSPPDDDPQEDMQP